MRCGAPRVSVIVAAHHSARTLPACLEALARQSFRDFETLVVSSPPDACTRAVACRHAPAVRLLESGRRLLPHAARNRGVAEARGDILVFTDADCRADADWLERLVDAHDAGHPVVCGSIEPDGASASWFGTGVHLCKYSFRAAGLAARPCTIAGTANACYARRVFDAVGPFEGERFAGDALLGWRASRRGFRLWFEPRAVVRHRFEHDAAAFLRERLERGEDFARARVAFEGWSRARLAVALAGLPLLPALPLARGARDALRSGRGRAFLATMPLQLLGHAAWCAGEARAHRAALARAPG